MLTISVPGWRDLELHHLILDMNGTLCLDGRLLPGVDSRLRLLARLMKIHIITADTFGTASHVFKDIPMSLEILEPDQDQSLAKAMRVRELGGHNCVAVGNGANDQFMLQEAVLAILILGPEGAAASALGEADILCCQINDALDLLLHPDRVKATLRR